MDGKKVNIEQMRYKVPQVCNRFFKVHAKFIIACFAIALSGIILAFSYSLISSVKKLEPKPVFMFFCNVDDYGGASAVADKYALFAEVYFAPYCREFVPVADEEDAEPAAKYDFSGLGSAMTKYNNPSEKLLLVVLNSNHAFRKSYNYENFGFENGNVLTSADVEKIIKEVI